MYQVYDVLINPAQTFHFKIFPIPKIHLSSELENVLVQLKPETLSLLD